MASDLEGALWLHCLACRINGDWMPLPLREHRFHPTRKWRFDFAWPGIKLAVEVEGSVHRIKGRFHADPEKHNAAVLLGWRLLRFTRQQIHSHQAIETIAQAMGYRCRLASTVPRERMAEARQLSGGQER